MFLIIKGYYSSAQYSNYSYVHWLHLLCFVDLWTVKAFLDLEAFPHSSQKWTTPAIWWASMCFLIASFIPSFPHTLHSQFFPCRTFLLLSIIVLICSSKFSRSALTLLSELSNGFFSEASAETSSIFLPVTLGLGVVPTLFEGRGDFISDSKEAKFGPIFKLSKGSNKKKREKSGQADRLGWPPLPPPPKRSGKCKNFSTSCHIWGYFAIL